MPLPAADEGMPLFPQPQGLRGSANADPQTLTRQGGKSTLLNDKLNLFALSVLAVLGHLSQGERQDGARKAPLVSQGELARKRLRG